MPVYDLFNGDADGICALQQLRLHQPQETTLITGIKRDINLFAQISPQQNDVITALDISFDKNRQGVQNAVDAGAQIFYADHHYAGELIEANNLELHIDTDTNSCTSLIINRYLNDACYRWAITGTYGDNLFASAEALADRFEVNNQDRQAFKQLGTCLNYNGYGFALEDLIYHPADLFRLVNAYEDPLDFMQTDDYQKLLNAYQTDLDKTHQLLPDTEKKSGAVFILPNEPWARRVNGVFSNSLAHEHPARAHAVLVECGHDCYRVSVRAPLENKTGADELCRQFESGGGRKAAAGINQLNISQLDHFKELFFKAF
jgi:hypothetical protein